MTPASISGSIIIFGLLLGMPISTNAEPVAMDKASTDGSFTIAQTRGQDRRDDRQDCRQQEGAVGMDKQRLQNCGRRSWW